VKETHVFWVFSLSRVGKTFFLVGYNRRYLVIILSIDLSMASSFPTCMDKNATKIKI